MDLNYTLKGAEEKILAGVKIHTIRSDQHNRWKPGRKIAHTVHGRTPKRRVFREDVCSGTETIFMQFFFTSLIPTIMVNGTLLCESEVEDLALNDGFDSVEDMGRWFVPFANKNAWRYWRGKIIHWTDRRYGRQNQDDLF